MKKKNKEKLYKKYNFNKFYNEKEIFNIIKKINNNKFDSSIDLYINIIFKKKKDFIFNEFVKLPYSNGKKYIILALVPKYMRKKIKKLNIKYIGGTNYIKKIEKYKWTNFDIIYTTDYYMNKILKLGKILGSKGLIPNKKNYTISDNPYKYIKEKIKSKIIELKINKNIINVTIGKISFKKKILIKNLNFFLKKIKKILLKYNFLKIKNIYISSTMGPSLKLLI
ncbi:MAG: 50S ribosomal protein L1 [Candidatus Shikimatogenerans bostrichidophilus]|nr:MAG: 50S ribosomal protein L1 [Candidatus Shikimatogenerans bostrichidophilus]